MISKLLSSNETETLKSVSLTGTVVVRLALFPLVLKSQRTAARLHNNLPQVQVLQLKMTEARNTGNALMGSVSTVSLLLPSFSWC